VIRVHVAAVSGIGFAMVVVLLTLGVLFAGPLDVEAQQAGKLYRVGFLTAIVRAGSDRLFEAFRQGLSELGWSEGRDVVLEYRSAESRELTPRVAAELIQHKLG
jgi:putative ABC transport system substrate-binding protein